MPKDNPGWWSRNANRVARPEQQTSEQAKRAPWVLLAFIALIVLVAVGVWALRVFWFEPSQTAGPTPQPSASEAPAEPSAPPAENGTCTLDTTDRDISSTPPEATRWVVERWAALPEVDGAGPCVEVDDYRVGFAPTQTGAVLATYHYLVHGNTGSPDAGTRGLLEHAVLDGPLKAAILQDVDDVENGVEVRVPDSNFAGVQFLGYRVVSFDDDQAVIEVLLGKDGATSGSLTAKLVWQDDDWRIDPASANEWSSTQRNVSAQGFVLWTPETAGD